MAQQGQLVGRWLLARSSRTAARDPGLRRSVKISDVARTRSQASAGDMIRSLALILIPLVVITIIFTNTPAEHPVKEVDWNDFFKAIENFKAYCLKTAKIPGSDS